MGVIPFSNSAVSEFLEVEHRFLPELALSDGVL